MSSNDNETQHLACIKAAQVWNIGNKTLWQRGTGGTYSSASSFLIPSQAFRRFCLTPLWLSHLPEGRHQCEYLCKLCLDKVDTSKPTKLPESGNLLFSPISLRVARDFPKLGFPLLFLQLSAKRQKHKELPEMRRFPHFAFSFSKRFLPPQAYTYLHSNTVGHILLKSSVRSVWCHTFAISTKPEDSIPVWSLHWV